MDVEMTIYNDKYEFEEMDVPLVQIIPCSFSFLQQLVEICSIHTSKFEKIDPLIPEIIN
jgi:hypothetical protein